MRRNVMMRAHQIAKSLEGDYRARMSLALRQAWKEERKVGNTALEKQKRQSKEAREERLKKNLAKELNSLKEATFSQLESHFWNSSNREIQKDENKNIIAVTVTDITGRIKTTLTPHGIAIEGTATYSFPERGTIKLSEFVQVETEKGNAENLLNSLQKLFKEYR